MKEEIKSITGDLRQECPQNVIGGFSRGGDASEIAKGGSAQLVRMYRPSGLKEVRSYYRSLPYATKLSWCCCLATIA